MDCKLLTFCGSAFNNCTQWGGYIIYDHIVSKAQKRKYKLQTSYFYNWVNVLLSSSSYDAISCIVYIHVQCSQFKVWLDLGVVWRALGFSPVPHQGNLCMYWRPVWVSMLGNINAKPINSGKFSRGSIFVDWCSAALRGFNFYGSVWACRCVHVQSCLSLFCG